MAAGNQTGLRADSGLEAGGGKEGNRSEGNSEAGTDRTPWPGWGKGNGTQLLSESDVLREQSAPSVELVALAT